MAALPPPSTASSASSPQHYPFSTSRQDQHPQPPNASPSNSNASEYPLRSIAQPHPHDVLCGRGGGTNQHIGNSHWRMLVQDNKQLYVTLPKRQKMLLSQSIVKAVRSQIPPGRFLQKDPHIDLWYDVGDQRATEKTSQALREGAPDIRSKIGGQPDSAAASSSLLPEASSVASGSKSSVSKSKPKASPSVTALATASVSVPPPSSAFVAPVPLPPHQAALPSAPRSCGGAPAAQGIPPAMAAIPPHIPHPVQPQGPVPDRRKRKDNKKDPPPPPIPAALYDETATGTSSSSFVTESSSTATTITKSPPRMASSHGLTDDGYADHRHQDHEPVEPPAPLDVDQAFSLGSIAMTDAEQAQLMNGCSIGSAYDFQPTTPQYQHPQHHHPQQQQPQNHPTSYQGYNDPYRSGNNGYGDDPGDGSDPYEPEPLPGRPHDAHYEVGSGVAEAAAPLPVDGGLEPAGFSLGSVMSTGTTLTDALDLQNDLLMKLEPAGFSLGSMMSYVKEAPAAAAGERTRHGSGGIPLPPDAGLEAIGTSFGSLTLATAPPGNDYEYHPSAAAPAPPPAPSFGAAATATTLLQQQRSTVNLLDCSDSDEEQDASYFGGGGGAIGGGGSGSGATGLSSTKSADYEKLRATLESQNYAALPTGTTSRTASAASQRSAASRNKMPPPAPVVQWHTDNNHCNHHQYAPNRPDASAVAPPPQFHFQLPSDSMAAPATTAFYRDVSQMSALSVDDDYNEHGFGGAVVPGASYAGGPASAPPSDQYHHYQDTDAMPPPLPPPMMKPRDDNNDNNNSEWERADQQYLYYNR